MNIQNQWCAVTGASSGIGESFAKELAKRGANIILVARRKERLEDLQKKLQQDYGVKVDFFVADLSDLDACDAFYQYATKDGRKVQMLINNAGRGSYGPFLDYGLDEHLKTIGLNIVTLTKLTYLFTAHMAQHQLKSYIGNVASIASYMSVPQFGVYSGSKKFVRDLTETLNFEYRNSNILFTCISPGGTWTEFMDNSGQRVKKSAHATMMTSEQVVDISLRAMKTGKPSIITGWLNWFMCLMPKFLPSRLLMHIINVSFSFGVEYVDKKQKA